MMIKEEELGGEENNLVKRFVLKLLTEQETDALRMFKKICSFKQLDIRKTLINILSTWVLDNYPTHLTLVTEKELLHMLKKAGLKTNKPLIAKYRDSGALNGMYWADTTRHVVYDYFKVLEVVQTLKEKSGKL